MQDPTEAPHDDDDGPQVFHIRTISGSLGSHSIVLQNQNGPCALVAIANTLALRDTAIAAYLRDSGQKKRIDEALLKSGLGEFASARTDDPVLLSALAEYLPKLTDGLDVNPRFNGTFEDGPELQVFASFGIPLVHGWVLGDVEREDLGITDESLSSLSYEKFCELQFSDTPSEELGQFVQIYQSQLTPSGYMHLLQTVPKGELAILFWNNHFSTILNHKGQLLILATDLGYENKAEVVWEELEPSGAGKYLNGSFKPSDEQLIRDAEYARQLEQEQHSSVANRNEHRNKRTWP